MYTNDLLLGLNYILLLAYESESPRDESLPDLLSDKG